MYKLKYLVKNYAWGKPGSSSLIAQILSKNNQKFKQEDKFAEIWMGTNPSGQTQAIIPGKEKPERIQNLLGNEKLTYLFKILNINMPLSIQMHPNKKTAEFLHEKYPDVYKDDNHKPELFYSISDSYELFYGFKPIEQAVKVVKDFIPISVNFKSAKTFGSNPTLESYKKLIEEIIFADKILVSKTISEIIVLDKTEIKEEISFVQHLCDLFNKEDNGIIISLFLNHLYRKKGDFFIIGPNKPHSYIDGNSFEIMANSDNVIRLGLTPKFIDKENFVKILDQDFMEMIYDDEKEKNDMDKNCTVIEKDGSKAKIIQKKEFKDFALTVIEIKDSFEFSLKKGNIIFVLDGGVKLGEISTLSQYESVIVTENYNKTQIKNLGKNKKQAIVVIASSYIEN